MQRLADTSPAVARLASLQALGGARWPTVQRIKEKKGVKYAGSEAEALKLLRDYTARFDLDFDTLGSGLREHALRVAQTPEEGGIDGGERLIWGELNAIREAKRRAERAAEIKEDADSIESYLEADDLAVAAFRIARKMYAGGAEVNGGIGGEWTVQEFDDAYAWWCSVEDTGTVTNFHAFKPSNKAEQGKGNVGATLATREVQGNLLCFFKGKKINMHVDIKG